MVWWGGVVHGVVGCLWELVSVLWKSLVTGARLMCFGCLDILVEMVFCHCKLPMSTPSSFYNGYLIV